MADRSITLFELHLHEGVSLGATNPSVLSTLRRSRDDDEAEVSEAEMDEEMDELEAEMDEEMDELEDDVEELEAEMEELEAASGRGRLLLLLMGVAIGAYVAFRMLGGDDLEELEELDDLADADATGAEAGESDHIESEESA